MKKNIKELIDITGEKRKRLQAICKMTSMQSIAISEGDGELLLAYIKEKQRHIDAIDKLDESFTKIYDENIKKNLKSLEKGDNQSTDQSLYIKLKGLIDEVQGIIGKIYDIEKTNHIKGKNAINKLKDKIGQVQVGQKSYTAYNKGNIPGDGIYIDEKQ